MVGEDTFYEKSEQRDTRFRDLVAQVTKSDPEWVLHFIPFLRNEMNMRSAAIVTAVEYVIAGGPHGRQAILSSITRADEPGEVLGYYRSRMGRSVPQPIKRGIADAIQRIYNERNVIRYKDRGGYKMGDVIRITHPQPIGTWQSNLFKWLLKPETAPEGLPMLKRYLDLMNMPIAMRRAVLDAPEALWDAGMTWESVSGWLQGPMDAKAWESLIPSMGYMALLRNLRNFEDAGISDAAKAKVIARLTDPEEVARSKQFPIRFYSAFKAVRGFGYLEALDKALDLTLQNVPSLPGRTLILVDNSGSMDTRMSGKSERTMREIAALFGAAVAIRAESADLIPYDTVAHPAVAIYKRPLLKVAADASAFNGSTNTFKCLQATYKNHDRVIILTDEQAHDSGSYIANIKVPIYTFNLVGYNKSHLPSDGNRYLFGGGLTDAAFKVIPLLEGGKDSKWEF